MQEIIFLKNTDFVSKMKEKLSKIIMSFKKGYLIKRVKNYFLVKLSLLFKRPRVWGYPFYLMIEPTNICNLKCPLCPTGEGTLARKGSLMDFSILKMAIDELGDYLLELNITNYGEPFIHDRLCQMITYIKGKGIKVNVGTNGHFFKNETVTQEFILSGVDEVYISLDGTNQESYSRYRIKGDFEKVVGGIRLLVETRNRLRKRTPFVEIQFLVMQHNEHQLDAIRKLAADMGVDRLILKPVSFNISEWKNQDVRERFKGFMPQDESFRLYRINDGDLEWKQPITNRCEYLWRAMVMLCDGTIVPCCLDPRGEYRMGSATDGLMNIWNSH